MALSVIAVLVLALLMLRLKINISYADGDIKTELRFSVLKIPLDKKKDPASKKPIIDKGDLPRVTKAVLGILDGLRQRTVIEKLKISCIPADPDPYNAVIKYNMINAVLGSALSFAEEYFKIKDKQIYTQLDLDRAESMASIAVGISIRALWLLRPGFRIGSEILKIFAEKRRKRGKRWRTNSAT